MVGGASCTYHPGLSRCDRSIWSRVDIGVQSKVSVPCFVILISDQICAGHDPLRFALIDRLKGSEDKSRNARWLKIPA